MKKTQHLDFHGNPSPLRIRLVASAFIPFAVIAFCLSVYWLGHDIFPLYGRIYRDAPIVETPYLGFFLLMGIPGLIYLIVAATIAIWQGKKFNPPRDSKLSKFQSFMLRASIKTAVILAPALIIITTLILMSRNYTPCPKLLLSGSAWQLFWVNDESACFKPDHYINDHWPCKVIDGKDICVKADGR
ncbi:hypothetical protein [Pseudomonas sp. 10-1B]|uniref:hypothetical protein n=1 Tax=Pseudomonas sp. 10-1B TaxID=1546029 RepID=UPI000AAA523D|nr:hypothetical protein [Pseudomonas sp. 10-1B]